MTEKGLYVPGEDGRMRFRGVAEKEERQILTFEEDTGVIMLDFHQILIPRRRKMQDLIVQTRDGIVVGVLITSVPMGPKEVEHYDKIDKERQGK